MAIWFFRDIALRVSRRSLLAIALSGAVAATLSGQEVQSLATSFPADAYPEPVVQQPTPQAAPRLNPAASSPTVQAPVVQSPVVQQPVQQDSVPGTRLPVPLPAAIGESTQEAPTASPPTSNPGGVALPGMIEAGGTELVPPPALTIADVIASVYQSFPDIIAAREQGRLANGLLVEAYGAYDVKAKAETLNEPTGFYENYRHGIGLARQTWWGGQVAAGYRVGRGVFQPWYLERETEQGGEFKLGYIQPLMQGLAIDPQRVAVFQASLERRIADPILQQAILDTARDAVMAYWSWVGSGAALSAQRDLLRFAKIRGDQLERLVQAGQAAEIDIILNSQLIAERQGNVIKAEQKFRASALKLSFYLRNEQGQPLIPDDTWLLPYFPVIEPLPEQDLNSEIVNALSRRPEPRRLQIEIRQLQIDLQLARNQVLPRFDFVIEGSQDFGGAASKSDDKGEFVLVIGAQSEVPIQRRKARGKIQSTLAKITQKSEKLRAAENKISIELQIALSNLALAADLVEQALLGFEAAIETRDRYEVAFDRGLIDLISLNLLEIKATESEIKLIEARQSWFTELAAFQAAAGLDPRTEANLLIQLPLDDSDPVGEGGNNFNIDQLEQDLRNRAGAGEVVQPQE